MIQRDMPDLMGLKNILVLNDEAHRCYRPTGNRAQQPAARFWISILTRTLRDGGVPRACGPTNATKVDWTKDIRPAQLAESTGVIAAREDGLSIGRIRMRQIPDSSVPSLIPHVQESVEAGRDWAICRWKSCDSADHAIPILRASC